jgi:hypothetical protein
MQTILRGYFGERLDEAFAAAGVLPTARPENLTPRQFQLLATTVKNWIPA